MLYSYYVLLTFCHSHPCIPVWSITFKFWLQKIQVFNIRYFSFINIYQLTLFLGSFRAARKLEGKLSSWRDVCCSSVLLFFLPFSRFVIYLCSSIYYAMPFYLLSTYMLEFLPLLAFDYHFFWNQCRYSQSLGQSCYSLELDWIFIYLSCFLSCIHTYYMLWIVWSWIKYIPIFPLVLTYLLYLHLARECWALHRGVIWPG